MALEVGTCAVYVPPVLFTAYHMAIIYDQLTTDKFKTFTMLTFLRWENFLSRPLHERPSWLHSCKQLRLFLLLPFEQKTLSVNMTDLLRTIQIYTYIYFNIARSVAVDLEQLYANILNWKSCLIAWTRWFLSSIHHNMTIPLQLLTLYSDKNSILFLNILYWTKIIL